MKRREFSAKVRQQRYEFSDGRCECCGIKLQPGRIHYEYDHDTPDYLGGQPTFDNCRVYCRPCHSEKTRAEAPRIAKARRIYRRHIGIKKRSRFPGAKTSPYKKKIDGTVVRRDE